jgi:uncharacterized membrane protein YdjX (TVP38/TMEM64 family)
LLAVGLIAFFAFGLHNNLSFDNLHQHRETLVEYVAAHGVLAVTLYLLCYATVIAFSLPGGAIMTITGGFLFGTLAGTVYTVVAATVGASVLFVAARTALGDLLRAKAGPAVRKMEAGFRENALSYLLALRLIPVFPFWLVNLVPALLGVPFRVYLIGTFFGIIPGCFVFASVGNGLGTVFAAGGTPDRNIIFAPEFLLPIIGLALLALIPVAYKKFFPKRFARLRSNAADGDGPAPEA